MPIYFRGTLFEAFLIRNQFDDYIAVCKNYGIDYMEVSDGSINIPHAEKNADILKKLTKHGTILNEIRKQGRRTYHPPYKWIELMKAELSVGSTYVIAEAREAGNVGIYGKWRGTRRIGAGNINSGSIPEGKNYLGGSSESAAIIFY